MARKIKNSDKFCWKKIKIIVVIDPDTKLYGHPKVPSNVEKFKNFRQTKGKKGKPFNHHGERFVIEDSDATKDLGQDDLNETGDETTRKAIPKGKPQSINHHTLMWEYESQIINLLK